MNTKKIEMKNEVNRALRAKKRFVMLTGALMCMLFVSESAWAYSYYGALKATAVPDNQGVVYVAESTPITETIDEEEVVTGHTPAEVDYSAATAEYTGTSGDAGSGEDPVWMTAYAIPNQGYVFNGWSDLGGDGEPSLDNCTISDNPIQVQIKSSTTGNDTNTATINANFIANPNPSWNVQYLTASNGTYAVKYELPGATQPTIGGAAVTTFDNDLITLTATPASGYVLYRYYGTDADGNTYTLGELGKNTQTVNLPEGTVSVCAEFTSDYFLAAGNTFNTLADAIQATRQNDGTYSGTILQMRDYTVPAGYYTIPAGVTLLIPKDANQVKMEAHPERVYNEYTYPTAFRKLTLANGAHLDVFGTIQTGGTQCAKGQINAEQNNGNNGTPIRTYGWLFMNAGSSITLNNGAHLYSWGYVTGQGTIDARRGSVVHECFQIKDWRGGTATYKLWGNSQKVFPLNQYYIQNIECPITFRPGSQELCDGTVSADSKCRPFNDVNLIGIHGSGSLFEMDEKDDSEDTWVRKSYDATNDIQLYEINSAAKLGSITIVLSGYSFTSGEAYYLPLTNNMKIHLLTGKMEVSENAELLPGAEIEINKEATVYINSGRSLYLFSIEEWDKFNGTEHTRPLPYSPSWAGSGKTCPRSKVVTEDAKFTVHGTVEVHGQFHTTKSGAAITSTNADAGTIIYYATAPTDSSSVYVANNTGVTYNEKKASPALLRNEDALYPTTSTTGTPAGRSYCYMNGKWTMLTVDAANECFVYDQYGTYYAKPGAYVPLANGKTENADHTYSDANGQGRLYILMDECQWWEVELDNNLYKGITRDANDVASPNGKYYAYNNTSHKWEEKRYTITWKDWDGTVITTYQLTYGVTPKYLSTNPTRPADVDYTYNFTGWSPAITEVTGDQIYTATYSSEPIKYTIIFKFDDSYLDGKEISRQQLARNEMPTIPTVTRAEYTLQWEPAVAAVTGNATYEATWLSEAPTKYEITFYDYDGTTVLKQGNVNVEDMPTAPAIVDGKPQKEDETFGGKPETSEFTYEFDHWSPAIEAVSLTSAKSYTAVYRAEDKTYAIRFYKEDGTTQIGETQELALGADPEVPEYAKEDPEAGSTYKLKWINKATSASVGVSVPSVSGAADYKADFDVSVNRYTVSVQIKDESGNAVSGCAATGSGTYDHGTEVTINVTPAARFKYWDDDHENTNPQRTFSLTAAQNLTAICVPNENVAIGETVEYDSDETYYDFVISADENHSSQVVGANHVNIATGGHAYFDLTLNTQRRHWRAFTVPFEVDVREHPILADGVSMPLGKQYDIVYYDGAVRAAQGKVPDCWRYVEDGANWILTPGKAYMIVFGRDVNTVRFTKKDDASIKYTGTVSVSENHSDRTGGTDGGWNGIGNPATYHAMLSAGVTECQVHNGEEIGSDGYITCDMMGKFIVGKAVFVQVAAEQTVVVNKADSDAPKIAAAPRRATATTSGKNRFDVQIAPENGKMADRMFLLADEDKEDKYVILSDLAKAGLSTKRAQIWVDRYDTKLCKNTAVLINGQAEYPLGIFAPAAGDYTIQVAERPDEETILYLTLDGRAIWNLTYGAYITTLEQGTTDRYGLRLVQKAPQVATGIDEAVVDAQGETKKVLINDKVYILRGEKVYSVDGQLVK